MATLTRSTEFVFRPGRGRLARTLFVVGLVVFFAGWFATMTEMHHVLGQALFVAGLGLLGVAAGMLGAFEQLSLLRLIQDLPTAKIRSAPQGYVELSGRVQAADAPLECPKCGRRCLWFQYVARKNKALHTPAGATPPVILDDGTGRCRVEVAGAALLSMRGREYEHVHIEPGDTLHVLGEFRTDARPEAAPAGAGRPTPASRIAELHRRLAELKADPRRMALLDVNRDGQVDAREWEAARRAAEARLDRDIAQLPVPATPPVSRIGAPATDADRLPFVIVVGTEKEAVRATRFEFARRFVVAVVIGAVLALVGMNLIGADFAPRRHAAWQPPPAQVRQAEARVDAARFAAAERRAREAGELRHVREVAQQFSRVGRWHEVIGVWDDFLATHPRSALGHHDRGIARYNAQDRAGAIEDMQRACKLGLAAACQQAQYFAN